MSRASTYAAAVLGMSAPAWPPPAREPLPPFPEPSTSQPGAPEASCWTFDAFDPAVLPFTPPAQPDLDFHRGNVMGVRVPGKPYVGGESSGDPEFLVTWLLYLQSREWQAKILHHYRHVCGYTHIDFHRAAWMGRMEDEGVPGCTRATAIEQVRQAKAAGLFVIVNLAIDNGAPDRSELEPWIRDLAVAGMDIGCLAWQADQRMGPSGLCDYIAWAAPVLHGLGCKVAVHWINEACAWWSDENEDYATCKTYGVCDRFSFQAWATDKIDYHYQQFDVDAPLLDSRPGQGGLVGAVRDVLRSLTTQKLVIAEYDMQAEFNWPKERLERYGDLKGRALMAASGHGKTLSGYLNGARQPDGRVL